MKARAGVSWWLRLSRLSFRRKRLLFVAMYLLCWATICVRWLPFKSMTYLLGVRGHVAQQALSHEQLHFCRDWAWALSAVSSRLPWRATCLIQALAGQCGLRSQRIAATVYVGVASGKAGAGSLINAHAWLNCGQNILTGASEATRFKPIVWFGTDWQ